MQFLSIENNEVHHILKNFLYQFDFFSNLSHNRLSDSSAIRVFFRHFGGAAPASCICHSFAANSYSFLNISIHAYISL